MILGLTSQNTRDGEQWQCTCGWASDPTLTEYDSMHAALAHWDAHDPTGER